LALQALWDFATLGSDEESLRMGGYTACLDGTMSMGSENQQDNGNGDGDDEDDSRHSSLADGDTLGSGVSDKVSSVSAGAAARGLTMKLRAHRKETAGK
jgi:hypothetical protein